MTGQAVRVERSGPVTTVFLHRPARRNAVDGPTAARLAAAFRAFDADPDAAVAARELAAQLAAFPQVCLRSDRASVLDAEGLGETAALASEFAHGHRALEAAGPGVARFIAGAGRHGVT